MFVDILLKNESMDFDQHEKLLLLVKFMGLLDSFCRKILENLSRKTG